jgi:hypothetical protein
MQDVELLLSRLPEKSSIENFLRQEEVVIAARD